MFRAFHANWADGYGHQLGLRTWCVQAAYEAVLPSDIINIVGCSAESIERWVAERIARRIAGRVATRIAEWRVAPIRLPAPRRFVCACRDDLLDRGAPIRLSTSHPCVCPRPAVSSSWEMGKHLSQKTNSKRRERQTNRHKSNKQ